MQELVRSLENNKDELVGELKKGHDHSSTHQDTIQQLQSGIQSAKMRGQQLEEQLHSSQQSLKMINSERDEM